MSRRQPSPRRRHRLAVGAVLLLVVLAGCGGAGGPKPETRTSTEPTTPPATTLPATIPSPKEFPEPPATLTNASATRIAAAYEEAYVFNRLREYERDTVRRYLDAYTSYQFGVSVGTAGAEVLNRSRGGIYVAVEARYYVSYERNGTPVEADFVTESVYFVSRDTVRRVRGSRVHER